MWILPCCKNPIKMSFGDYIYQKEKGIDKKLDFLIGKLKHFQNIKIENTPIIYQTNMNTNSNSEIQTKKNIKEILKELKETTIQLKQKLDMLTSERNVMEVEFSQAQKSCGCVDSDLPNIENVLKSVGITDIDSENLVDNLLEIIHKNLNGMHDRHDTKRILEIIGNVDKQNMEIKKILEDTRHLQKEINSLEGKLGRYFSIADETLFKDAKKDDQAKKAYKLLVFLHSECNTIVSLVNKTRNLARGIVDLEDNIKTEKSKRTENILQKVQLDLANL
ncbi:coiled-coil domain-containing protein 22 homolog [Pieris rapae]|uniref:coiled-coil domain-containing protein 22 homolog n=1 Tax=Pieris rapae TaxID=64459 RepID=UPI001E27B28D|nr:coiled-coil domain-containing protein 22 homolog [Pieris rapae]